MRRSRLLLGLVPVLPVAIAVGACTDAPVQIGLVMRTPLGLLDQAKTVTLTVFDAAKGECLSTGHVNNLPTGEGALTFELKQGGCAGGAAWCTEVELDRDDSPKIFAIVAKGSSGILAEGCAVTKIDQDPLAVDIKVQRYNPPACCNDGTVQTGEQCDVGPAGTCLDPAGGKCAGIVGDAVCRCDCTAEEILLSVDNTTPPALTNGEKDTKVELTMAFSPGRDGTKNALRTAFTNTEAGGGDIHMRFLRDDFYAIQSPFPLSQQIKLPALCVNMAGSAPPLIQHAPSVASVGLDRFLIAYASNQNGGSGYDAYLNIQNEWGCADASPVKLTTQIGDNELRPDVAAGPTDAALIVWHRGTATFGRIWRKSGGLDPDELTIASNAKFPRVAGNKDGWVVVFEGSGAGDGDGVFMTTVSSTGTVGSPALVNDETMGVQDQPDIAMLEDGRSLVVWHSTNGDDIRFQHYDAARARVMGADEQSVLNTATEGLQQHPVVTGGLGFFAVAWEDAAGQISGRFLGGTSGFGFNSVTGQNDAFVASTPDPNGTSGNRVGPAVAIGGAGFVAFGWEDKNPNHHGVFVRRFPLPAGL
ncbi:MAG TPA: hypothetical protein PK156_27745 [Polyangium sp.]|nr:hypothetical protein [Polyangium sp.]